MRSHEGFGLVEIIVFVTLLTAIGVGVWAYVLSGAKSKEGTDVSLTPTLVQTVSISPSIILSPTNIQPNESSLSEGWTRHTRNDFSYYIDYPENLTLMNQDTSALLSESIYSPELNELLKNSIATPEIVSISVQDQFTSYSSGSFWNNPDELYEVIKNAEIDKSFTKNLENGSSVTVTKKDITIVADVPAYWITTSTIIPNSEATGRPILSLLLSYKERIYTLTVSAWYSEEDIQIAKEIIKSFRLLK
ncbi:hypothetical protein HGA91_06585 [candidate division WWE3 bacterium]|nr:hypothetical protein [candidate division WWE3 bacterium]